MAQHYLIDGYNVLHADPSLEKLLERDSAAARAELEKRVNLYCRSGEITATIVYDARSVPQAFDDYIDGEQPLVVYTGSVKSADDFLIDESLRLHSHSATVVTADKAILTRATKAGCSTMRPGRFLAILRKKSTGRRGPDSPKRRTDKLSPAEIKRWMRLFGNRNKKDDGERE